MKRIVKIFFLFLLVYCCKSNGQVYSHKVLDSEINDFFSWRTSPKVDTRYKKEIKRINLEIITWDSTDYSYLRINTIDYIEKYKILILDSILNKENKEFIKDQIMGLKTPTWNKPIFKNKKLIKPKNIKEIKKGDDYFEFSIPLYTLDRKWCFVKEAYHCGFMCSDWALLLYEKLSNGQWKVKLVIYAISS